MMLCNVYKTKTAAPSVLLLLFVGFVKKETVTEVTVYGAGDEARTRYLHLGKVALYRMSYARRNKRYYNSFFENVNTFFPQFSNIFSSPGIPQAG